MLVGSARPKWFTLFTTLSSAAVLTPTPRYIIGISWTMRLLKGRSCLNNRSLGGPATKCARRVKKGNTQGTTNLRRLWAVIIFLAFQEKTRGRWTNKCHKHTGLHFSRMCSLHCWDACESLWVTVQSVLFDLHFSRPLLALAKCIYAPGSHPVQPDLCLEPLSNSSQ